MQCSLQRGLKLKEGNARMIAACKIRHRLRVLSESKDDGPGCDDRVSDPVDDSGHPAAAKMTLLMYSKIMLARWRPCCLDGPTVHK